MAMLEVVLSDYSYGDKSEEFIYVKISLLLIMEQKFRHVSSDAKCSIDNGDGSRNTAPLISSTRMVCALLTVPTVLGCIWGGIESQIVQGIYAGLNVFGHIILRIVDISVLCQKNFGLLIVL